MEIIFHYFISKFTGKLRTRRIVHLFNILLNDDDDNNIIIIIIIIIIIRCAIFTAQIEIMVSSTKSSDVISGIGPQIVPTHCYSADKVEINACESTGFCSSDANTIP